MAKALDPDIERDAAFCLANEKCVEQEKHDREIDKNDRTIENDRLHTDALDYEDEVSVPYLFLP